MKIRKIYVESTILEDMSKDRVKLDLSWNEWIKLRDFIKSARWEIPDNSKLRKQAQNLNNCFKHAQKLESKWIEESEE